jgi:hypothetical protein
MRQEEVGSRRHCYLYKVLRGSIETFMGLFRDPTTFIGFRCAQNAEAAGYLAPHERP